MDYDEVREINIDILAISKEVLAALDSLSVTSPTTDTHRILVWVTTQRIPLKLLDRLALSSSDFRMILGVTLQSRLPAW